MFHTLINIKNLFPRRKHDIPVSQNVGHGIRCISHVTNLTLFGIVIVLTLVSVLLYYFVPVTDTSQLSNMIEIQANEPVLDIESGDVNSEQKEDIEQEAYSVISERNVFSHERKEWIVKAVIPNTTKQKNKIPGIQDLTQKTIVQKKAMAGKPKKIILHGIVIAGMIKKALIDNPLTGVHKKRTLFVQEGDELEGYKVTSIEKDRIKLDWHGEEIVVVLYAGIQNTKKSSDAEPVKSGGLAKYDVKSEVVEDTLTGEGFDADAEKVAYAGTLDETSLNLLHKESEYFFMPVSGPEQLTVQAEMREDTAMHSDSNFDNVVISDDGQDVMTKLDYKYKIIENDQAEENIGTGDSLIQYQITGKPVEIVLQGIVIVTDKEIKKALVNVSESYYRKDRTLYVEEGDTLEEYRVTSIEADQLRLDWHGKKMIIKFPPL